MPTSRKRDDAQWRAASYAVAAHPRDVYCYKEDWSRRRPLLRCDGTSATTPLAPTWPPGARGPAACDRADDDVVVAGNAAPATRAPASGIAFPIPAFRNASLINAFLNV